MRHSRPPTFIAYRVYDISWETLYGCGIGIIVLDTHGTLCPIGTHILPDEAVALIKELNAKGFEVWLASKGTSSLGKIQRQLGNHAQVFLPSEHGGAEKPDTAFFEFFTRRAKGVAFVGDRLTDLGVTSMSNANAVTSVLVNPMTPDPLNKNTLRLRRQRERFMLRSWGIKRATRPGEFRLAQPSIPS
jgi:predicted HAD superfamily phosphohydrolase YqeG